MDDASRFHVRFHASFLRIAILHEFRHWRTEVEKAPRFADADALTKDRCAAEIAVDLMISLMPPEFQASAKAPAGRQKFLDELLEIAGHAPPVLH